MNINLLTKLMQNLYYTIIHKSRKCDVNGRYEQKNRKMLLLGEILI